jgi:hypothetical protein
MRSTMMARYLLSVHTAYSADQPTMDESEVQRTWQAITALEAEMAASDTLVLSGRLTGPDLAAVVRVSDGATMVTDGPFAETKELLGGFYVLDAPDLDAALGWASRVTAIIGAPIEVRPFAPEPGR